EIVAFVVGVTFLLAILRLSFLLAPIAAVEHRAGLLQSWRLTKGNAWRIVVILLAIFVPVWILAVAGIWFFVGDAMQKALQDMTATQPWDGKILMQFEAAYAFVFAAVGGVALVVASALQAGATAAAYRT